MVMPERGEGVVLCSPRKQLMRVAEIALRRQGCKVTLTADGDEALEKCRKLQPAVLILDASIANPTAVEVRTRMAADPRTAGVNVQIVGEGQTFKLKPPNVLSRIFKPRVPGQI